MKAEAGPLLRTARLDLWKPQAGDLDGLMALIAAEETRRYLGQRPVDTMNEGNRLLRNAGSWALYGYGSFVVRLSGRPEVIGACGVFHSWRGFGKGMDDTPEAGWIIHADHCGKGLAGEAMRAALAWFDATHGRRRIACMIEEGNTASERVAASLGFARYGRHAPETEGEAALMLFERIG